MTHTTEKYKNYAKEIWYDEDPQNPRKEFDNLGTMVCWHSRYTLGDKQETDDEYIALMLMKWTNSREVEVNDWRYRRSEMDLYGESFKWDDRAVYLPLYLYDHSGITMSTGRFACPWDSGMVGFIYVTYKKLKEEYGWKHITKARIEKIQEYLRGEVEVYDAYLTGSVYGYSAYPPIGVDEDGDITHSDEEIDSCGGFYGDEFDTNGLMEYAKNAVDCNIEVQREAWQSMLKQFTNIFHLNLRMKAIKMAEEKETFMQAYPQTIK